MLNILRAYIDFADSLIFVDDFYKQEDHDGPISLT